MDYYQKNLEYFKDQHYQEIRKTAIESSDLFEDPEFKPSAESLFLQSTDAGCIEWKRPAVKFLYFASGFCILKPIYFFRIYATSQN